MGIVEQLQKLGLTEYEARVYRGLLGDHLDSATLLTEKIGVPAFSIILL
jgi:sugar-specific transcriptional regulator TrmB